MDRIRDGNVAAPLKRCDRVQLRSRHDGIRDGNVAAPLKPAEVAAETPVKADAS